MIVAYHYIFLTIIIFIVSNNFIHRMTVTRPDEYGVDEIVTELLPGMLFELNEIMSHYP